MEYSTLAVILLLVTSAIVRMITSLTPSDHIGCGMVFFVANDSSVDLTVIGGTLPYIHQWSNDATTRDMSDPATGYYEVVVKPITELSHAHF